MTAAQDIVNEKLEEMKKIKAEFDEKGSRYTSMKPKIDAMVKERETFIATLNIEKE